jgi:DNA polymerase
MDEDLNEIISDLRSYFGFLKEMGVSYLPGSQVDRSVPRKPRPSGRGQGAQYERITLPESPALQGGALYSEKAAPPENLTLAHVRKELGDCKRCKLHRARRTIVFGEGNEKASLMLIGEAPGYDEDIQGRPFVGKAGQLLTKILQSINLSREEVYIANIIKCRPPQNRNPEADEILSCNPFLVKQITTVQPRIICALGSFSAQTLLKTDTKITALRGKLYDLEGIMVIPTYHPAFLLRNPERKREVWEDMKKIAELMKTYGPT